MLEFIAFLCGASVMTLEMTGSRLMAPYLGASVLVWTALIGAIMAFLSVGYWLGGKMADKAPSAKKLAAVILAAAFCVILIGLFHAGLLAGISARGLRPEMAAVLAAVALFGPASMLLGMVSPYIVRVALQLRAVSVEKTGTVIGRFYAISTVGSIIGTFLGGYFFISWAGSRLTIYIVASVLSAAAILTLLAGRAGPPSRGKPAGVKKLLFVMPAVGLAASFLLGAGQHMREVDAFRSGRVVKDTRYSLLEISDSRAPGGRVRRNLYTPPHLLQSAMYLDAPNALALDYTRHFSLAWQLRPRARNYLMLGGAGYSIPKYLLATRRQISLDVVEIDPDMTALAREYFALKDDPRLNIYHEDARTYLNRYARSEGRAGYDIIMGDTFSSVYNIPFQLGTVECARKIYDSLAPDGIFISNIISAVTGEKGLLLRSVRASFAEVFPEVRIYPLAPAGNAGYTQNVMLMAFKKPEKMPSRQELLRRGPAPDLSLRHPVEAAGEINTAALMLKNEWRIIDRSEEIPPLYDDFAPVERYSLPLLEL